MSISASKVADLAQKSIDRLSAEKALLIAALEDCLTNERAMGYLQPKKYAHVRFDEINRVAHRAIEEVK